MQEGHMRVIAAARESWMPKTTLANLELLQQARERQGQTAAPLREIIGDLRLSATALDRGK
jgi:hypothetical protein